jgi:hypothetical protein
LNYRSGGRILRAKAAYDDQTHRLAIVALNRGRAAAQVCKLQLRVPGNVTLKTITLSEHVVDGSPLPHDLSPGVSARWQVDLRSAIEADLEHGTWLAVESPGAHLYALLARPVAPRVRVVLASLEFADSFVRGLSRRRFRRMYDSLFWARFPHGDSKIYRGVDDL